MSEATKNSVSAATPAAGPAATSAATPAATPAEGRSKMLALKERRGPVSERLLESMRANNAAKSAIKKSLADGPHTVPEIAEATGLSTQTTLWTVTAMRKYGALVEDSLDGSYPRYALVTKDPRS
jgi:hypothetical protein